MTRDLKGFAVCQKKLVCHSADSVIILWDGVWRLFLTPLFVFSSVKCVNERWISAPPAFDHPMGEGFVDFMMS